MTVSAFCFQATKKGRTRNFILKLSTPIILVQFIMFTGILRGYKVKGFLEVGIGLFLGGDFKLYVGC